MFSILTLASFVFGYCPESNSFCVSLKSINIRSCFTVHSSSSGYAGIGIGTQTMKGSDMYIGYQNSTDGVTIANMKGTGHVAPTPVGLVTSIPLLETKPAFSKLSFSFCLESSFNSKYIYAGNSDVPKGNIDGENVILSFHKDYFGSFDRDLLVEDPNSDDDINDRKHLQTIYMVHGILMFIAWGISPFIGIFIARYMKHILENQWYRLHLIFMGLFTTLVSFISFILIVTYRPPPYFVGNDTIESLHSINGLLITIVLICQCILGFISNHLFSPQRIEIPWWDKLHWWVGRIVFSASLLNLYLGIIMYDEMFGIGMGIKVAFFLVLCIGIGSLVYGHFHYGITNHFIQLEVDGES